MNGARLFFIVCLAAAVGLIGSITGSALHPQAVPAEASAGLVVWRANGCEGCHTLYGIGGNYGPDLTHIVADRGESYLREFFVNPNAFHPNQRVMPRLNLTHDDVTNLITLLTYTDSDESGSIVALNWPPHPIHVSGTGGLSLESGPVASGGASTALAVGQRLFGQNCASCHSLARDVIIIGPSLWGIATRGGDRVPGLSAPQYIRQSVLHPSDFVVPNFQDVMQKNLGEKLSADQLDSLIAFLMQYTDDKS